jgi:hypothetical protein
VLLSILIFAATSRGFDSKTFFKLLPCIIERLKFVDWEGETSNIFTSLEHYFKAPKFAARYECDLKSGVADVLEMLKLPGWGGVG